MTTTDTVEIPADVRDNSPHTVRVTSRDTRAREGVNSAADQLASDLRNAALFSYTTHQWDDVDRDRNRVTYTWFADTAGRMVWVFETAYFTRTACLTHDGRYAVCYASITDQDGVTTIASPVCGGCLSDLRRSARDSGMTLNLSEPLRIGQH